MFYLGLDLGKKRDFTALALIERTGDRGYCEVRYLERASLGTPFTKIVERVAELTRHRALRGQCHLTFDATGLGQVVLDLLRVAMMGSRAVTAVTITGGEKARQQPLVFGMGDCWTVPRKDLLTGLQVSLEKRELKIAKKMALTGALVRELTSMRTATSTSDHGQHDDLALAVALGCWQARRAAAPGIMGTQRLF